MTFNKLKQMYDEAIARCELGDAWEFERHFAAVVRADERKRCMQIVINEASQYGEPVWAVEILNDMEEL